MRTLNTSEYILALSDMVAKRLIGIMDGRIVFNPDNLDVVFGSGRVGFGVIPATNIHCEGNEETYYELAVINSALAGTGGAAGIIGVGGPNAPANLINTVYFASGSAGPIRMVVRNEVPNGFIDLEVGGPNASNRVVKFKANLNAEFEGEVSAPTLKPANGVSGTFSNSVTVLNGIVIGGS